MLKQLTDKLKKNKYKYFFVKLFTFLIIVSILDFIAGGILRYFYFKQESGWNYRTTYSMEKTKADLLIMGSSRAAQQYHPDIFEDKLKMSCYNCGRDGNFILYNYAVLRSILKRYKPKMIVLDFIKGQFKINPSEYDRLSVLLPYYKDHPEIRSIINKRGEFEKFKLLSATYPFNSTLFNTIIGNTEFNKERQKDIRGFVIFDNEWERPVKIENNLPPVPYKIDSTFLHCYESFIKDCNSAGVQLYIVCSPYFVKSPNADYSINLGKEIAKNYNVDFIDHSGDTSLINHSSLFSDSMHLNIDGAKIFSEMVADEIIKRIADKQGNY